MRVAVFSLVLCGSVVADYVKMWSGNLCAQVASGKLSAAACDDKSSKQDLRFNGPIGLGLGLTGPEDGKLVWRGSPDAVIHKCVDVQGGGTKAGSSANVMDCSIARRWSYDAKQKTFKLQDIGGMCLAASGSTAGSGIKIQPCDGSDVLQQWSVGRPAPAPTPVPPPPTPTPPPVFKPPQLIVSKSDNRCVQVPFGGYASDGTPLYISECDDQDNNQLWRLQDGSFVLDSFPTYCIDVPGNNWDNGGQLGLWSCNGLPQQMWGYDEGTQGIYLASSESDATKCFNDNNGEILQIWDCYNDWANQRFNLQDAAGLHAGAVQSRLSNLCLHIDVAKNGGVPVMQPCQDIAAQKWEVSAGTFKTLLDDRFCVDASNLEAGVTLMAWECNGSPQQLFDYDESIGSIYVPRQDGRTQCMAVHGDKRPDLFPGNPVTILDCLGAYSQRWRLGAASAKMLI